MTLGWWLSFLELHSWERHLLPRVGVRIMCEGISNVINSVLGTLRRPPKKVVPLNIYRQDQTLGCLYDLPRFEVNGPGRSWAASYWSRL